MSALIIRLPEEKRTRLKLVAKSRKVSVTSSLKKWQLFCWRTSMPKLALNCAPRAGAGESTRDSCCWTKRQANEPARSAMVLLD
jgi:hypothetical protein